MKSTIRTIFKSLFLLLSFLILSNSQVFAQKIKIPALGMKQEPAELLSSLKETNPNRISHRGLPSSVDLSEFMPPVGNQGQQGSCVAWSTAYATKSYQEYIERKAKGNWSLRTQSGEPNYSQIFSPAFIYNQINGGRDNGSLISDAMRLVVETGAATWEAMPYDEGNYLRRPPQTAFDTASKFKAKEFLRVRQTDPNEVKSQLSQGRPVVAGIIVYENFMNLKGKEIYKDGVGKTYGGHAISIVGYDDSKNAFKFINSWSTDWGDQGYGYIDYRWFTKVCQSAFVLVDQTASADVNPQPSPTEDKPVKPEKVKPNPPNEISASQGTYPDRVLITWESSDEAIGYEIYRKGPGDSSYSKIGLSQTNSFNDDGIQKDIAYSYKVTSLSDSDSSELSEGEAIGYAKTEEQKAPPKVVGLEASQGLYANKIELSWDEQEGASDYTVYKWSGTQKRYSPIGKVKVPSYTDSRPAKNGIVEYYVISAGSKGKVGEPSDAAAGYTAKLSERPPKPTGLEATKGLYNSKVELQWKKVDGANKYVIYRYSSSGLFSSGSWSKVAEESKENFVDENLPSQYAFYSIAAVNKEGVIGPFSDYAYGYIDPNKHRGVKLAPPSNLKGTLDKSSSKISLKWDAVKDASEYYVFRKKRGGSSWDYLSKVNSKTTNFTADVPEKETFYLFSVTAKTDLGGESEYSSPVSAVISNSKPAKIMRAFGGESSLEKFKGPWSAMAWDGSKNVNPVLLEIESQDNVNYVVKFNKQKIFEGKYIENSPIIDKDGKFKIELERTEDALSVTLKDNAIINQKTTLNFLKD
ncbi:cysteine protease [Leptospira perolatii]|uniref:Cysteine protease n=1 Tax=Leptospira perolatii TaxID=2023191 RepID=A0A2M9ZPL2_9LEPT|nr:C1 family peptidase [Leptospira perolatii]PJZ70662.1 cysteine protease [Leptospira perolatii]PJZ73873.1 cysteine protease [Leptospira perolatii]